jgi:mRNA interferase MazF
MRPLHIAHLDKPRPVVVLTREQVRPYISRITVAPITSTIRGLSTEVPVDEGNGLDHESVISLDNVVTIPAGDLEHLIGYLTPEQDQAVAAAIVAAFDLDIPI